MTEPNEIWKPIKHFPRYQVSNLGRIRKSMALDKWKYPSISADAKGYMQASMNSKGYAQGVKVARVVGAAFCADYGEDKVPQYKDGNRGNCRASNLSWLTRSQAWQVAKNNKLDGKPSRKTQCQKSTQ